MLPILTYDVSLVNQEEARLCLPKTRILSHLDSSSPRVSDSPLTVLPFQDTHLGSKAF